MNLDKKYLIWALSYAVVGLVLGIYMAASRNRSEERRVGKECRP